ASGVPYFRFDPAKPTGVEFGISQILKVPHHRTEPPTTPSRRTHPLGARADELLAQLRAAGDTLRAADLEAIIVQAIRDSGVTAVSQGTAEDRYVDLAVWSDDLSPWVGNPLPIEVRLALKGKADVNAAVGHLMQALAGSACPGACCFICGRKSTS